MITMRKPDRDRGTGRTTRQMRNAPQGAVFVWRFADVAYPRSLANKIGRTDLEIVGPDWLADRLYQGRNLTGLVIDHDAIGNLTGRQYLGFHEARAYIR